MSAKALETANTLAGQVYELLMSEVVEKHVLIDHRGQPKRSEKVKKAQANNKEVDIRTLYLLSLSGKGGWTDNEAKRASYLKNANITLLDHLLSVTRGALMLAAMDLLLLDEVMDEALLLTRLKVIAAIAFLHDLDKMEQLIRDEPLSLELVETAMEHYGIKAFLNDASCGNPIDLSAEQVRFLIEHTEDTQAHRHPPQSLPACQHEHDIKNYVSLADKLDGIWQQYGAQGGLEKVLERLQKTQGLRGDLLKQWEVLELFDPHHPFLLDELQRYLSGVSQRVAKIPPLIEVHQDGRLFMLLPAAKAEEIKQQALQYLLRKLPFSLYLSIPTTGVPELINDKPDYANYLRFIEDLKADRLALIFIVKKHLIATITPFMDELLGVLGLAPQWPDRQGQTSFPYANPDKLDNAAKHHLEKAASLALLLNLKIEKAKNIPDYAAREAQLLKLINQPLLDWIDAIDGKADQQSRRVMIALWALTLADDNTEVGDQIWGDEGLLKFWLEGDEEQEQAGFRDFFEDKGSQVLGSVSAHFTALLEGKHLSVSGADSSGHCIFTNAPAETMIADKMKLYGVKVSAFASRDGRPDSVQAPAKGNVHISDVSIAEYKLRNEAFQTQGGKSSGVPSLISSPVTTGLFSALIMKDDQSLQALSAYDLSRKKVQKGKVIYQGLEVYRQRYRMARFERMPNKLTDQVDMLRLLLNACLRIGRPIHVFRGLPTWQKAFFYYDAMPSALVRLLGFKELRIEQIPAAITTLEIVREILEEAGLGHDVFQLYAHRKTRLKAACLAWCYLRDRDKGTFRLRSRLHEDYLLLSRRNEMSKEEGALVRLGRAAARIQRNPGAKSSTSEEMLIFNLAFDTAMGLRANGQIDNASLAHGVAGELHTNLVRKDKMAARKYRDDTSLLDECMFFARQFVEEVWTGSLKQRPPSQTSRRLLGSVYRMAFLQASREKRSADVESV